MCGLRKQKNESCHSSQGRLLFNGRYKICVWNYSKSKCYKKGQIKGSQSQGLLLIEGIIESFMEEMTFKLGCEKVRKKASQEEGSVGMEMVSSEFSQSECYQEQQGKWRLDSLELFRSVICPVNTDSVSAVCQALG